MLNIVEILSFISSLSSVETALLDSGGFVSILDRSILFSWVMIKPVLSYYLLNALLVGCMTKRDTQMLGLKMPITERRSSTNSEGNRQGGPLKRAVKHTARETISLVVASFPQMPCCLFLLISPTPSHLTPTKQKSSQGVLLLHQMSSARSASGLKIRTPIENGRGGDNNLSVKWKYIF